MHGAPDHGPCWYRTLEDLSVDIDVIDSGLAPATGRPQPRRWTTGELVRVLRGVEELSLGGRRYRRGQPWL